jgi:Glu-tRNA(Gln) amidotransferase subunit E-like FAD-binding protein
MSSKKIPKIEIKKEYIEELSEIYPNAFEIKEKNIKVKSNLNKFYKKMIREKE